MGRNWKPPKTNRPRQPRHWYLKGPDHTAPATGGGICGILVFMTAIGLPMAVWGIVEVVF